MASPAGAPPITAWTSAGISGSTIWPAPPGKTRRCTARSCCSSLLTLCSTAVGRDCAKAGAGAAAGDSAEDAYNAGYRLWDQRRFADAQASLDAAATRYPAGRWISWIRNLQGRAYLDDNKPATAARILLANYQDNPRGERAADSLYYLGVALTRLNRRAEACRVYDELVQVYPNMRDFIRTRLPEARTAARCTAARAN